MQREYSLWTPDVEATAPLMAELGVGLVVFSPLGRGFLTATIDRSALGPTDFRARNPGFQSEAGDANEAIAETVREVAAGLDTAPAQVALAWVYAQSDRLGVPIVAILGTKRPERVEQNAAALDAAVLARLDPLGDLVRGDRYGTR